MLFFSQLPGLGFLLLLDLTLDLSGGPLLSSELGHQRFLFSANLGESCFCGGMPFRCFLSGSFSFTGDPLDTNVQTMYGVLDKGVTVAGRANLLQQTIRPADVAACVVFIASNPSLNGATLPADNGQHLVALNRDVIWAVESPAAP